MKLIYFASVRQKIGISEEDFAAPAGVHTVWDLVAALKARGSNYAEAFRHAERLRCAVNQNHVGFETNVSAGDEIAFFPSGDRRMSEIRIQRQDFDPGVEIAALSQSDGSVGAVASFVGLVRGDGGLTSMTLEHYPDFAEREIAAHIAEAKTRWPLLAVRVVHRTGKLTPGERIVFVGVSSAHRQAAFAAAEFLMDYLKTRAPFWKLEERAGGAVWVEAKAEDDQAAERWR